MSKSRSARALLRAACARVAHALTRTAQVQIRRSSIQTEQLDERRLFSRSNGIDVSHYQGSINWTSVRTAGYDFAYEKATEGVGVTDTSFGANMSNGASAGVLMGVYHVATPSTAAGDATGEASYFVQQAGQYMTGGWLRPALDLASGTSMGKTALSAWVNTFENAVQAATGVKPIIYTTNDIATNYLTSDVASNDDLWIVRLSTAYGDPQTTGSPPTGAWASVSKTWSFWQYKNTGTVAGINGSVDQDVFNGNRAALQAFVIPPPLVASNDVDVVRNHDAAVTLNVLANDASAANDGLSIIGVTQPTSGSLAILTDGIDRLRYTPTAGYAGTQNFTYTARASDGRTVTAAVSLSLVGGGGPTITNGVLPGTKRYATNDGFIVDAQTAFADPSYGNYSFTATFGDSSSQAIASDASGDAVTQTLARSGVLVVTSTHDAGDGWAYQESVQLSSMQTTAPQAVGQGTSQADTTADGYVLLTGGDADHASLAFTGTETTTVSGSYSGGSTSGWSTVAGKYANFSSTSDLDTRETWGMSLQTGDDTSTFAGSKGYSYDAAGGTVNGTSSHNDTLAHTYSYNELDGTYVERDDNSTSYSGSGNFVDGTVLGSVNEDGSGFASSSSTAFWFHGGGGWAASGGTSNSNDGSIGHVNASGSGTYSRDKSTADGSSTMDGTVETDYASDWSSGGTISRTLGTGGSWTTTSGSSNSDESSHNGATYGGSGAYSSVGDGGMIGSFDEAGVQASESTNSVHSTWSGGSWTSTGTSDLATSNTGHQTSDATGTYQHATTAAGENSSVSGTRLSSQYTDWDVETSIVQALDTDGSWATASGDSDSSGSSATDWSYSGSGTYAKGSQEGGPLTGTIGTSTASSQESGDIAEGGTNGATSSYNVHSSWSDGDWKSTDGASSSTTLDQGSWVSSGTGVYARTASDPAGGSSVSGTKTASKSTEWGTIGQSDATLGGDGVWSLASGSNDTTGSTVEGWNYSGNGTSSESNDSGVQVSAGETYHNSGSGTGDIAEDGERASSNVYSLHSGWSGGAWITTGDTSSTFDEDGDWASSGVGTYLQVTTSAGGGSSVDGDTGKSHSVQWGSSGNSAATWSDSADVTGGWVTTEGSTDATGTTVDGWTYSGSGTSHEQSDSGNQSGGAGETHHNSSSGNGDIAQDGTYDAASGYSLHSGWTGGSWATTGDSTWAMSQHESLDSASAGTYSHVTNTPTGSSSVDGNTNKSHAVTWGSTGSTDATWSDASNNGTGDWLTTAGTGSYTGSTTDGWTYAGSGNSNESADTGIATTTGGVTFQNSSSGHGPIDENGTTNTSNEYNLRSDWSNGSWATSGDSTWSGAEEGDWASSGNGTYTHVTSSATGNSSVTGDTGKSHAVDWDSNWSTGSTWSDEANGGTGGYVQKSGTGDDTVSTKDGWTYSGHGTYTGSATPGTINEDGSNSASNSYNLHSSWSDGAWSVSGESTYTTADGGNWTSSGQGNYTRSADGGITVTGAQAASHIVAWGYNEGGDGTWQPSGTTGAFVATDGSATASGSTQDGWTYGGKGSGTLAGVTSSIDESGHNESSNTYLVSGNFVGGDSGDGAWDDSGNATATTFDAGSYVSSSKGSYSRPIISQTGGSTVSGSKSASHSVGWSGGSTAGSTWSDANGDDTAGWVQTSGTGTATTTNNDGWSYGGSGSYTESNGAEAGSIAEDGQNSFTANATVNSTWTNAAWHDTGTATGTTLDSGHWSTSGSRTFVDGSVTGPVQGSRSVQWNLSSGVTASLDPGHNWATSGGSGTSTGTTVDGWTYSGAGAYSDGLNIGSTTKHAAAKTTATYSVQATWQGGSWHKTGTKGTTTTSDGGQFSDGGGAYTSPIGFINDSMTGSISFTTLATHVKDWSDSATVTETYDQALGSWTVSAHNSHVTETQFDSNQALGDGAYTRPVGAGATVSGYLFGAHDTQSSRSFQWTGSLGTAGGYTVTGSGHAEDSAGEQTLYGGMGGGSVSYSSYNPQTSVSYTNTSELEYSEGGNHSLTTDASTDWTLAAGGNAWTAMKNVSSASGENQADYGFEYNESTEAVPSQGGKTDSSNSYSMSQDFDYAFSRTVTSERDAFGVMHTSDNGQGGGMGSGRWKKKTHSGYKGGTVTITTDLEASDTYGSSSEWNASAGANGTSITSHTTNEVDGDYTYDHVPSTTTADHQESSYSDTILSPGFSPKASGPGGFAGFNPLANQDPYYGSGIGGNAGDVGPSPSQYGYGVRFSVVAIAGPQPAAPPPQAPHENGHPSPSPETDAGKGKPQLNDDSAPSGAALFGIAAKAFAYDIVDRASNAYNDAVERTAAVMARNLEQGGSTASALLDGLAYEGGKLTGATDVVEGIAGIDIATTETLSTRERIVRTVSGGIQLATIAVPAAGEIAELGGATAKAEGAVAEELASTAMKDATAEAKAACEPGSGQCFIAGTAVLLGDGSKEGIEEVHVGDRVATDGGVANSADGKTSAADPDATAVDPSTWRLVTIEAHDTKGEVEIETLVPLSWLSNNSVIVGGSLALSKVVDLVEMGAAGNLVGTVESIAGCPKITGGHGRVVLTTVNRSSDDVYTLTLADDSGRTDSIGVTGGHRFYTEDRGWVAADNLARGEIVRTAHGNALVEELTASPSIQRVYNMSVEADHVFYVGTLHELVHNNCNGSLTDAEFEEIQGIADRYQTRIDVVGSRAENLGRDIESNLPVGKGNGFRSDIDFRIDSGHPAILDIIEDLKRVGNGAGSASLEYAYNFKETVAPYIRFLPNG